MVTLEKIYRVKIDEKLLYRVVQEGITPAHPWEEPVILIGEEMETRQSFD